VALRLKPWPETAEKIARRLGSPAEAVRKTLDKMAAKGQIASLKMGGDQKYALVPFVVGIYEFQLERLDKELADLVEEYFPILANSVGGPKPSLARVIPVDKAVETRLEILSYENLRQHIRECKSFALRDCICRKERALQGRPCRHTMETCMQFSREEGAFDYFNYGGRVITKDEALEALDRTENEGLVHATYNVREDPAFVCNCCSCCCGFLRGMKEFGAPNMLARSNFVAVVDPSSCNGCGICAAERCPMEALEPEDGVYRVLSQRCIGCGVCAISCPQDSIRLARRPDSEQTTPPKNIVHWSVERMSSRSGPLTRMALKFWLARQGS
jgi:Pyruvate/2-oxoacid:ferredoxin oxidoreductase delta subunit